MDRLIEEQHNDGGGPVLLLIPDVFFAVTVRNTVRRIGYEPHIVKLTDDLVVAAGEHQAVLAIVDLAAVHSTSEWDDIGDLVADGLPVLVFGSHKDVDGLRAAKSAGVTRVVSNGQFHREMAELIQRYALAASCALVQEPADVDEPLGSLPPGMSDNFADADAAEVVAPK
ncbi:MAG TPA: hypothetical protein VEX37_02535 [Thermomicrobiales bacterium]|nr:hypothetical protein [Thermomicrobiales bacterium]